MSVIIVGGGMTGATLALAISRLTQGQLPVHLIEAVAPQRNDHPGFDARAIAIAQGTCQHLARIGIWQAIADCATAIKTVHVSDRGHAGFVTLEAQDYRIDALGQVVELHDVGLRLFRLLKEAPGVTLHCPARVTHFTRSEDQVSVTLDDGSSLTGELLVAADGSRSALGQQCGIQWQQQPYHQLAVIANVATAVAHQGRAFERFTEYGPLAMLPMSEGRSSLVWSHPLEKADEIKGWSDERFRNELQQAFGWRLGRITHVGQRAHYPLALTTASQAISHRVALVGNAAQTLHPIAGQGFNLGLRDVMTLAETLAQAFFGQEDCGAYPLLCQYQHRRQRDKEAT
ncbi:MAG: 2-octaprenyl-6-methoxyphenyl hydroxylase, partial [Enterobacteriaceae bacterium]